MRQFTIYTESEALWDSIITTAARNTLRSVMLYLTVDNEVTLETLAKYYEIEQDRMDQLLTVLDMWEELKDYQRRAKV